ncbi:unnamed protein product [Effrenium voratum]|nr:unnamed protein product [Effrenium voratum]
MDPYKVLGIPQSQVKHPSDLDKVRQRAKKLYKRYAGEQNKFQMKKVMEAFDMVKGNMKKIGEGAYKLLGRGRKERELDRHFNHQTKEIKKDRRVKKTLKQARRGEKRFHLPGDKERIPTFRRKRKRRRHMKIKKPNVDVLQGLQRLAAVLPQRTKFPKVVKLLYRWVKEYMNIDNREYIFRTLNDLTRLPFLAEDKEGRQDVICVFEYVLSYNTQWFDQDDKHRMLGRAWQMATVLWCQCFTDDAFTLSSTISKLTQAFALIEKHKPDVDAYLEEKQRRAAKHEAKLEAKLEAKEEKLEAKLEAKEEAVKENGKKMKLAEPVEPAAPNGHVDAKQEALSDGEDFFGGGCEDDDDDDDDEMSEEEEGSDDEILSEEGKKKSKAKCIDLDSDAEVGGEISSEEEESVESVDVESSSEAEELESFVFPVPNAEESIMTLRKDFVQRCLFALFQNRGPLWARTKVDTFFQEVFYRRACLDKDQQTQVEAWQARIKVLQKESEHKVGEANNILESGRPVVDSREMRTNFDADSNSWASKQTFDSREKSGARHVIR